MAKLGEQFKIVATGEVGKLEAVSKYIGLPWAIRLTSGRLFWCGPEDARRVIEEKWEGPAYEYGVTWGPRP